jgi:hypothetical protein
LVAQTVPNLLCRRTVVAQAVGLHDQAEVRPVEIDLVAIHVAPGLGVREPRPVCDWQEETLQLGVGEGKRFAVEFHAHDRHARPAGEPLERGSQFLWTNQVELVGLADCGHELSLSQPGGQIDDRADRRGDRNSIAQHDLVSERRRSPVNHDPGWTGSQASGHRHLDLVCSLAADPPKRCCGFVAQRGFWAAPQHGGHPDPALGDLRSAYCIDAPPDRVQTPL